MTVDLDALEALAKAAALDEWWSAEELGEALTEFNGRVEEVDAAEYIAAADPSTVLALIAELRQERERADEATNHAVLALAGRRNVVAALSRAEETIERLEAKSLRLSNANYGEWIEIPAEDWDAILTEYDKQKEKS